VATLVSVKNVGVLRVYSRSVLFDNIGRNCGDSGECEGVERSDAGCVLFDESGRNCGECEERER